MIFFQPIILTSQFVQHVFVIVLVGTLCVEYVTQCRGADNAQRGESIRLLLAIASIGAAMLFIEYFFHNAEWWLVASPVPIAVTMFLVVLFTRRYVGTLSDALRQYLYAIAGMLGALVVISILNNFYSLITLDIASSLFQTAATVAFYFFVLQYLIYTDHEST